jgi:myo-inositol catabolism protein IolS
LNPVQLGSSGLQISSIGVGTWQIGDGMWGRGTEEKTFIEALLRSFELGMNFIDTAEIYNDGNSERIIGQAIQKWNRDEIVIATKVSGNHLRPRDVIEACERSLQRLGVKEIDVYFVHWPDPWDQVPLRHTMKAMETLYKRGKIRAIGVSNFAVRDLEEARSYLSSTDIVSNEVRCNMLQRDVEEEVLPYCRREGIQAIAYSPLAQGALTGKYAFDSIPPDEIRTQNILFAESNFRQISKLIVVLREIADSRNKNVAQVALNWLNTKLGAVPIPGAKNIQQAEQNAGAMGWELAKPELSRIEGILKDIEIDYFKQPLGQTARTKG